MTRHKPMPRSGNSVHLSVCGDLEALCTKYTLKQLLSRRFSARADTNANDRPSHGRTFDACQKTILSLLHHVVYALAYQLDIGSGWMKCLTKLWLLYSFRRYSTSFLVSWTNRSASVSSARCLRIVFQFRAPPHPHARPRVNNQICADLVDRFACLLPNEQLP